MRCRPWRGSAIVRGMILAFGECFAAIPFPEEDTILTRAVFYEVPTIL
jgi:hypothetical protein